MKRYIGAQGRRPKIFSQYISQIKLEGYLLPEDILWQCARLFVELFKPIAITPVNTSIEISTEHKKWIGVFLNRSNVRTDTSLDVCISIHKVN